MNIERLSLASSKAGSEGSTLVMVGSFAPVHYGHIDTMQAATRVVESEIGPVNARVFAPNSDSYVSLKLNDTTGLWGFERRVAEFETIEVSTTQPFLVDDISGRQSPEESISQKVVETISQYLGTEACRVVLVVGSDQIRSMEPHLETNVAVCVVRPTYDDIVKPVLEEPWLVEAVNSRRYLITRQEDPDLTVSSTAVRNSVLDRRGLIL